jgi:hypothetical protein
MAEPDPARVRELAEQLVRYNARVRDGDSEDALTGIPENDTYSDEQWAALATAVERMAATAQISVTFPESA